MKLPGHIESVVRSFQKIQGVGRKTAERYVFDILSHWTEDAVYQFSEALSSLGGSTGKCPRCRACKQESEECPFCAKSRWAKRSIAVVASLKDLYHLESVGAFQGTYFVLDGLLSPLDQRGIADSMLELLYKRIEEEAVEEIFLALDSSPEGEATAFYLCEEIKKQSLKQPSLQQISVTTFATGMPAGASFEYLDKSTIGRAFVHRVAVQKHVLHLA